MKNNYFLLLIFSLLFSFFACTNTPSDGTAITETSATDSLSANGETGVRMIPVSTSVGDFKVWTRQFGESQTVKVLLLHGGPAMGCEYMECFRDFLPKEGFELYEYDQLGSYRSDQPDNDDLWHTERFVEEVEQVRKALGMNEDNFYLIGNSWGGILGMEYALKYQQNLKGLVVANMQGSIPEYAKYNGVLRSQMRKSLVDSLTAFEDAGDFKNPVYTDLIFKEYYTKHICRLPEWPDAVNRSFEHVNEHIYVLMQGPSEFKVGGRLISWDIMGRLPEISVPTLMVGAKYDTMDPAAKERMSKMVQKGRYLYCPEGSHLAMWDDQGHFFPGVVQFLKDVDGGRF